MAETDRKKVVLGFSGGVDSSVAALLLKEKGYEVHGLYFDVLPDPDGNTRKRAESCAETLGISFTALDLSKRFEDTVIRPFCDTYFSGKTPNPCILCNPSFKFQILLEEAERIRAYWIATGHYAALRKTERIVYVAKASNREKDQSYMLCRLGQHILQRTIFPLSDYSSKEEIRKIALEAGLQNAAAKDSQDICFIPDGSLQSFLSARKKTSVTGNFISPEGKILCAHAGQENYTIGQRKGLGIALGRPVFVKELAANGDVLLGDPQDLLCRNVLIENLFHTGTDALKGGRFKAKLRYTRQEADCFLEPLDHGKALLMFEEGQRAPAPGQEAVLYKGDRIVCCGTICRREEEFHE